MSQFWRHIEAPTAANSVGYTSGSGHSRRRYSITLAARSVIDGDTVMACACYSAAAACQLAFQSAIGLKPGRSPYVSSVVRTISSFDSDMSSLSKMGCGT